jgi:hypothetical protein
MGESFFPWGCLRNCIVFLSGIFHLYHHVGAQKVSDFENFWLLDFHIRGAQPVSILICPGNS